LWCWFVLPIPGGFRIGVGGRGVEDPMASLDQANEAPETTAAEGEEERLEDLELSEDEAADVKGGQEPAGRKTERIAQRT
jgi:hypothetical protein